MQYTPTIGLEIHAELKTKTKMFCGSKNDPDEVKPNTNICPVCVAHPGTLPVINKEAVRHVLRVGAAIEGTLADYTEFDRKNYFYPDVPKNYQISQYKYPLVSGGSILGVDLTRIHLEEDSAKSSHTGDHSLVDFNRAGIPLMELVTEPVMHEAALAVSFARELQMILRYLGASDANLEKGEMRIEANISVSRDETLGTKVEVKNLNSFKAVEGAIAYEIERHVKQREKGESVIQETRGWDENKQATFSQRLKEESHDYRYFPDPDLPKLVISKVPEFGLEELRASIPELPSQKRDRYSSLGVPAQAAQILTENITYASFFDEITNFLEDETKRVALAANYFTSDVIGYLAKNDISLTETHLKSDMFIQVMEMLSNNELSSRGAKDLLHILLDKGGEVREVAERDNLLQKSDLLEIEELAKKIISENKEIADEYRGGKEASLQYLMGQGMKISRGSANPGVLIAALKKILK